MSTPAARVEITLSHLTYRGDRDERLVELVVTGEADTDSEAFRKAFENLKALGHDPFLMLTSDGLGNSDWGKS